MIHYKTNDNILEGNAQVLVNPVNCVGVMKKIVSQCCIMRRGMIYDTGCYN